MVEQLLSRVYKPKCGTLYHNLHGSGESAVLGEGFVNLDGLFGVVHAELRLDIVCFAFLEKPRR